MDSLDFVSIGLRLKFLIVDLRLSWDLFILVFFSIIIAYSFIIGRNSTVKVIIASYMAILTADSLGNLFQQYLIPAAPSLQGEAGDQALILVKIFIFVLAIVLIVVRGGFLIDMLPERSIVTRILSNLSFGFLNAGLIICTLLVYLTGGSFISGGFTAALQTDLYQESNMVKMMVDQASLWFALPAIALVLISFFEPGNE